MSDMKDERPAIRHFARQPYAYAIEPFSHDYLSNSPYDTLLLFRTFKQVRRLD